jgi:hypothetical protein
MHEYMPLLRPVNELRIVLFLLSLRFQLFYFIKWYHNYELVQRMTTSRVYTVTSVSAFFIRQGGPVRVQSNWLSPGDLLRVNSRWLADLLFRGRDLALEAHLLDRAESFSS